MFFSGEASTRKRVDLGGRSSKERDRQKVLEQARFERKRRLDLRQQTSAASKIQKHFRGRRVVRAERSLVRDQFHARFGDCCQNVDRNCFAPDSLFLSELLFCFDAKNHGDLRILVATCKLLQTFAPGNTAGIFIGPGYSENHGVVIHRIKKFVFACLWAVHQNRLFMKNELLSSCYSSSNSASVLLEAAIRLTSEDVPWSCKVVNYLFRKRIFSLLRDIMFTGVENMYSKEIYCNGFCMENILIILASHCGCHHCSCTQSDPFSNFSSQILSIPFLWDHFPLLKEVFVSKPLADAYIEQISHLHRYLSFSVTNISNHLPGHAYLLGNVLEVAGDVISRPNCTFDLAVSFTTVAAFLLDLLPPLTSYVAENVIIDEDEIGGDDSVKHDVLYHELEKQILNVLDPRLLHNLVNVLFMSSQSDSLENVLPGKAEVVAVGSICSFLHVLLRIFPVQRIMPVLAYRTKLVPVLWRFIKQCHEKKQWPALSDQVPWLSGDYPGWILPLAVFCPVYRHMLMLLDNEEFYEQEKPLTLTDIRVLIVLLREALWELLWVGPGKSSLTAITPAAHILGKKRLAMEFIHCKVGLAAAELLSELQDWNNRGEFTCPLDFYVPEAANESFVAQAVIENTRASEILKKAPFLIPFTSRVKIFTSYLAASRQRDIHHAGNVPHRFRIRRNHIFEDAFDQLNVLSDDELKGLIRITFINELGVEEAGVDGGGIFKDFMENIVRVAFDVQYGLFKETMDHLLYPNPGSRFVHEQHLQYFYFLGCLLGKAMFEGILVDIPFATFFLRALKEKKNLLNDLPSLDHELYRHLLFLKHYEGDISDLELYFVIINNEYGEQSEAELVPGGKHIRVTNKNVREFIHCVARYRLNYQISPQSKYFLRGFQKLIRKEWMDIFSEHELQLLISGSLDGLDVDDLCAHVHYAGGYSDDDYVIKMFWDIIRSFSPYNQKRFLKFVTGCSRGPLLGFRYLEPQFCIQRTADADPSGENVDRLPTSATCMNLLKLPPYRSKEQLELKLMYAINADAGFDLS